MKEVIDISTLLQNDKAISHSQGLCIYEKIKSLPFESYILSFENISIATTSFLNASIGKLTVDYGEEKISSLNINCKNSRIASKINRVIDNALNYEAHDQIVDNLLHTI